MNAPAISFVIGGVQKGGTTALAHHLSRHPQLRLPACKEAHVFDAPDFDERWSATDIDARFAPLFDQGFDARPGIVHGDATPISLFHPTFVHRMARYNPRMRWIVLLRHPVERAISQYYMEYSRGDEHLALPLALLAERSRLRGHENDFSLDSPLRHHSYLARGRYVQQLAHLFHYFPRHQVLLLRNQDLRRCPRETLHKVFEFLEVAPIIPSDEFSLIFSGDWQQSTPARVIRPWLARWFAPEIRELERRFGVRLKE